IDLDALTVADRTLATVPGGMARKHQILPIALSGATLTLALADPTNVSALDDVTFLTGYKVESVVASEAGLETAIERYYGPDPLAPTPPHAEDLGIPMEDLAAFSNSALDLDALADLVGETSASDEEEIDLGERSFAARVSPATEVLNAVLVEAWKRGASAIHVEACDREFRIRFRIDGVLHNVMALPPGLREPLTSRIKTLARLDVREKRLPPEGRAGVKLKRGSRSRSLALRVSCLPTFWGETIVLHLVDRSSAPPALSDLGFGRFSLERYEGALRGRGGLVV